MCCSGLLTAYRIVYLVVDCRSIFFCSLFCCLSCLRRKSSAKGNRQPSNKTTKFRNLLWLLCSPFVYPFSLSSFFHWKHLFFLLKFVFLTKAFSASIRASWKALEKKSIESSTSTTGNRVGKESSWTASSAGHISKRGGSAGKEPASRESCTNAKTYNKREMPKTEVQKINRKNNHTANKNCLEVVVLACCFLEALILRHWASALKTPMKAHKKPKTQSILHPKCMKER